MVSSLSLSFLSALSLFLHFHPVAAKMLKAAASFLEAQADRRAKPRWLGGSFATFGWADGTEDFSRQRLIL